MNLSTCPAKPESKPGGATLLRSPLFRRGALILSSLALSFRALSADPPPKAPVPPSPYVPLIYRFADAMLEHGRDTYGPQKTGLFLSALDRKTLAPLTTRPRMPDGLGGMSAGVEGGFFMTTANVQHDENLLRLLYTLSELSSKPVYREAADAGLKWFLENTPSPVTHLLPWGKRLAWDVMKDEPTKGGAEHQFTRPWLLWDRCFDLALEPSKQFALGLWEHHVDHDSGIINDRTAFDKHDPRDGLDRDGLDIPAAAGYFIRTWSVAYARTKDERLLRAIEVVLQQFEKRRDQESGLIEIFTHSSSACPLSSLSLAIDCEGAAHRVHEPLASRLRTFAAREDAVFCALPHELKSKGGFVVECPLPNIKGKTKFSHQWHFVGDVYPTTPQAALMCLSRYENTGSIGHRDLMIAAAESGLNSSPPTTADTWPMEYAHAISLQVAAWRHTARAAHLEAARRLADEAVAKFFDGSPLPRASVKSEHYESITGADTLALALVELHLNILAITAVRSPANTIDR